MFLGKIDRILIFHFNLLCFHRDNFWKTHNISYKRFNWYSFGGWGQKIERIRNANLKQSSATVRFASGFDWFRSLLFVPPHLSFFLLVAPF